MRRLARHLTLVALASAPAIAHAQAASARPQRFYFRGVLGVGYGVFGDDVGSRIAGFGALGNFALGVHIAYGIAVHIDACAMSLVSPTYSVNGAVVASRGTADSTSTTSIIGGGVTWRHPSLFWVSVSGGVSVLGVEKPGAMDSFGRTGLGWGLNILAGRDWTFAHTWHVGVALHGLVAGMPDQPVGRVTPMWTSLGGGVSITVTDH
mgnify:CR=1 FL=1